MKLLPLCMEMDSRVMSLVLVIWMGCLCSSQAYTFYVGGNEGWITHPSDISYHRWAEMNRFQINDTLVFRYKKGSDSVLVVTKDDYERCNKDSPLQVFKDGDSKFKFDKSGPFFFLSGRTQHCEKGQKLVTVVLSDRHHNAPPSPSPTHSPPMKPPPSHSPPPPSHNAPPPHLPSAPSQTPTHSPPPSHTPPPSSHIAPAPTPQPTQAPPPHSTISAPPSKAPQTSPIRSPIPTPSHSPKNPPQSPSHSPSPSPHHQSPTPSPDAHSPPPSTPKTPPSPSPAVHLAPSPSPKTESPKNGDGAPQPDVEDHQHPAPSPHASSPAYPHHAPAPAPSAAPGLSASYSLLVGIFTFAISLLSAVFV